MAENNIYDEENTEYEVDDEVVEEEEAPVEEYCPITIRNITQAFINDLDLLEPDRRKFLAVHKGHEVKIVPLKSLGGGNFVVNRLNDNKMIKVNVSGPDFGFISICK